MARGGRRVLTATGTPPLDRRTPGSPAAAASSDATSTKPSTSSPALSFATGGSPIEMTSYYAAMRPGEALGLRRSDCTLPASGWGRIELAETRPSAGKAWTDSGEAHDRRGLKQRAQGEVRIVPIPPPLVRLLREHLKEFGTAKDSRLFSSERGKVVAASSYSRAWKQARELTLVPDQVSSVLAFRPYDLRHAGVSLWLNQVHIWPGAGDERPDHARTGGGGRHRRLINCAAGGCEPRAGNGTGLAPVHIWSTELRSEAGHRPSDLPRRSARSTRHCSVITGKGLLSAASACAWL